MSSITAAALALSACQTAASSAAAGAAAAAAAAAAQSMPTSCAGAVMLDIDGNKRVDIADATQLFVASTLQGFGALTLLQMIQARPAMTAVKSPANILATMTAALNTSTRSPRAPTAARTLEVARELAAVSPMLAAAQTPAAVPAPAAASPLATAPPAPKLCYVSLVTQVTR